MRYAAPLALALSVAPLPACSTGTTAEGAGYVFRVDELIATLPYAIGPVYTAADRTVREDMQWVVESTKVGDRSASIVARGAGDRTRRVSLVKLGNGNTEVRVNVNDGPFGNTDRSLDVLARIEERLASGG